MNIKKQILSVKSTIATLTALIRRQEKLLKELETAERSRIAGMESDNTLPAHFFKVLPTDVDIDSLSVEEILPEKKHMPGQPGGVITRTYYGLNNMGVTTVGELKKLSPERLYKKPAKRSRFGDNRLSPRPQPANFGSGCIKVLLASMRHHNVVFDENKK